MFCNSCRDLVFQLGNVLQNNLFVLSRLFGITFQVIQLFAADKFFCYKIFLTASIPTCLPTIQCDQIGLLLKSLGDIFACKISPNIGQLYVQSKKLSINVKTTLVTFWGNFAENWATFNSSVWSHCYHLFGVRF